MARCFALSSQNPGRLQKVGRVASASQLKPEARWMVIVRYAFRLFSFEKARVPALDRRPVHAEPLKSAKLPASEADAAGIDLTHAATEGRMT